MWLPLRGILSSFGIYNINDSVNMKLIQCKNMDTKLFCPQLAADDLENAQQKVNGSGGQPGIWAFTGMTLLIRPSEA